MHELQRAFADGDAPGVCASLTRTAQEEAGNVGHEDPTTCERDVTRVFEAIRTGGGWGSPDKPLVRAVRQDGDTAQVTIDLHGWRADVPFVKDGGRWKLAAFFGAPAATFDQARRRARDHRFGVGQSQIEASRDGDPCPPLAGTPANPNGGCQLRIALGNAPIEMLTPLGDFKFGDCSIEYRLLVDRSGRTWTTGLESWNKEEPGCSDIAQCVGPDDEPQPWSGQIRSDGRGGFIHHSQMCLRTCIGLFAGDYAVKLRRDGARWRAEASAVGATGFRIGAPLPVVGDLDLDVT